MQDPPYLSLLMDILLVLYKKLSKNAFFSLFEMS
ncbi:hypothetical protein P615_12425 [Brevibacillus laterosporus PE36]|nr:hypothetical protein P615_12425 [Brevibacillus laterosporus PE36]